MAKRILIADDSVTMQKAFAMTFAAEDVTVMAARSAEEALALARQSRPDLVIADIAMPGRSGYELCQSIKSDPGLRGVPVFVLGSVHTPVDEARVRHCGADGQTLKPFDSAAMIHLVWDAVARGATAEGVGAFGGIGSTEAAAADARALAELANIEQESATGVGSDDSDDYGEIAIEESAPTFTSPEPVPVPAEAVAAPEDMVTPPPEARPSFGTARPHVSMPTTPSPAVSAAPAVPAGMRPSLIPGLKPGVVPAAGTRAPLPGATAAPGGGARSASTARPASPSPSSSSGAPAGHGPGPMAARGQAPPVPASTPATARTLVGLPVVSAQPPPRPAGMPARAGAASAGSAQASVAPPVATLPPGMADGVHRSPVTAAVAVAASRVDQKMAAFAARGPEYEAIAKLSREIIERVVWEVVPQLAEAIVREELAKRGRI